MVTVTVDRKSVRPSMSFALTGPKLERLFDRRFAVHVGNAVFADDDLGVDPLLVDVAEHFDHLADRPTRRASATS